MSARDSAASPVLAHLPALAWTALVGILLTLPSGTAADLAGLLSWLDAPGVDKLVHAALFFVLAVLLARSFLALGWPRAVLVAVVVATAYGAGLEVVQGLFTDRAAEFWDAAADLAGAATPAALVGWREAALRRRGRTAGPGRREGSEPPGPVV